MKNFIYFLFFTIIFVFLISLYFFIKQKKANNINKNTANNINKNTAFSYSVSEIHIILTCDYDISAFFLFYEPSPTTPYVCVGLSYNSIQTAPTNLELHNLLSQKMFKFFAYKLINENNEFFLYLINENACFILNSLEIDSIIDIGYCYTFRCKFMLINNYTFEEIFKDNMNGTFEKCTYKNDVFYLPIKMEKINLINKNNFEKKKIIKLF